MIPEPSEEELALYAIFKDPSGIDQAEFCLEDPRNEDGIFRAWPVQVFWWRRKGAKIISAGSRSIGKSLGASIRAAFFPYVFPGEELVITAPEGVHLDALTDTVETTLTNNFMAHSMLAADKRSRIKHRPFLVNFASSGRVMGRIPKHDGSGVKGSLAAGSLVLTRDRGLVEIENVVPNDYVWSHEARWTKVLDSYKIEKQKAYEVRGQGAFPLIVNEDHRLYVRKSEASPKQKRKLGLYGWDYPYLYANQDHINLYWSSPLHYGQELEIPEIREWNSYSPDFWWSVGRVLAGGDSTEGDLSVWLAKNFGQGKDRYIPTWVLTMNESWREGLVDGFLSIIDNRLHSSSKKLALGIQMLMHTLGRGLVGYVDNGDFINYRIESVKRVEDREFYGLITEDRSYFADGVIHHNTHPMILIQDEACFPAETLVLTNRGQIQIDEVKVGDLVWTHKNRWRKVLNVWNRGEREVVNLKGQGHNGLVVTPNHRFWSRKITKWRDGINKWGIKEMAEFDWIKASDLYDSVWSSPRRISKVGVPNNIPASDSYNSYGIEISNEDFLWCMGLYLAEGSTSSSYGAGGKLNKSTWSIHKKEVEYVTSRLAAAGLHSFIQPVANTDNCLNVVVSHVNLASWFDSQCGSGCYDKTIPLWVHTLSRSQRQAVYDGLIYGDGTHIKVGLSTTSKKLAFDFKLLAQSLDMYVEVYSNKGGVITIRGQEYLSSPSYTVRSGSKGFGQFDSDFKLDRVNKITSINDKRVVYDIEVEEDHSFVADTIVVHNSDFPERGWRELPETVQRKPQAQWLSYGVTVGPGNTFDDKISGHDQEWEVIKLPAMYRPTWTDEERAEKILEYGGYEDIDYQRNVLGTAEGADSSLIVYSRLLGNCTDVDEYSDFNTNEYYKIRITEGNRSEEESILDFIDPPYTHLKRDEYKSYIIGMDYGLTTSDTCILVFAETLLPGEKNSRLKLLSNISMSRISTPEQFQVVLHLLQMYRPKLFSFDAHGIGDGVFQLLQEKIKKDPDTAWMLDRIIGHSFSKKIVVGFDDSVEINLNVEGDWKRSAIEKITGDASLDYLRDFVDNQKLYLPYDKSLIGEIKSVPRKGTEVDEYNKSKRKKGGHQLDALRFALLAKGQEPILEIIKSYEDSWTPPPMILLDYN